MDIYFDGAMNVYENGTGATLISPVGAHFQVAMKLRFPCTNYMAEYEVCIVGIKAALDMNLKDFEVYGDSILIISQ